MKRLIGILLFAALTVLLFSCWSSNTAVYTGPPSRTTPLNIDSATAGAGPYQPALPPDSLFINFEVPGGGPCPVKIELRNSGTRLVRTIIDSVYAPGKYSIHWDKKDNSGALIRHGLYYYKFYICGKTSTRRLDYRIHWE